MSQRPNGEKYTVLVVEDSATLRQMITMSLQERGYLVTSAPDGITGLHALAEITPDAILLDLNLPDIDGFEVCKRMKADSRSRNIPILVMTSLGESGFEIMAIEAGADDFVAKPVDPLVLDARIQMIVRRMRRERFSNALTGLPANALTEEHIAFRLTRKRPFGAIFIDIDGFRAFNKRYGFSRGDLLLHHVAELISESVRYAECEDAFTGHLGADDFVVLCEPDKAEEVARQIVRAFDLDVMDYYEDEDRERGYFMLTSRSGTAVKHGPMTISAAVMLLTDEFPDSVITLTDIGQELLTYARSQSGSTVAVERRARPWER
ncbi:MAG: response regulator [Aeromicrobium sp.]|jgi:diguanylate cyclase (GGDEF)-like protein|nr:response regulator [Aeromicrobium sp.]